MGALDKWSEWEARNFPDDSGRPVPTDEWVERDPTTGEWHGMDAMADGNLAVTRDLGERLTHVPPGFEYLAVPEVDGSGYVSTWRSARVPMTVLFIDEAAGVHVLPGGRPPVMLAGWADDGQPLTVPAPGTTIAATEHGWTATDGTWMTAGRTRPGHSATGWRLIEGVRITGALMRSFTG